MGMKWDYDKNTVVEDPAYQKKIKQPSAFGMLDAWLYTSWSGVQYEWAKLQKNLRMSGPFGAILANQNEGGLFTGAPLSLNPLGITTWLGQVFANEDSRGIFGDQIINIIKPNFNLDGKTVEEAQSILTGALKGWPPVQMLDYKL
jgi:hypothetical protein